MASTSALILHPRLARAPAPPPPARRADWRALPTDVLRLVARRLDTARDLAAFSSVCTESRRGVFRGHDVVGLGGGGSGGVAGRAPRAPR